MERMGDENEQSKQMPIKWSKRKAEEGRPRIRWKECVKSGRRIENSSKM